MKIGYVRVSINDQNLDLQIDVLQKASCTNIYQEVVSSAKAQTALFQTIY